jgi:coiled-coil domain-containing protein 12
MEDRKARIAALRAKAGRSKQAEGSAVEEPPKEATALATALATDASARPPATKKQKGTDENEESVIARALRETQAEAKRNPAQASLEDLAPKKINADLKREIEPKLHKLERRTQKAIVALLRERLEQEAAAEIDE